MTERAEKAPVLYEDAALLVTVKPSGMLSAQAEGKGEKSLPELLSPDAPLFVVHRLDRPTAGVMVYAKTAKAAAFLQTEGEMEKTYLAVCEGVPEERAATLCDLLFFDRTKDKSYIVTRARRGVKEARLSYEVEQTVTRLSVGRGLAPAALPADGPPLTLLRVTLDTGRTHQIRAQFAHRGLPLCGDRRYGAKTNGTLGLFAHRLSFVHPTSGKRMTFEAPMPDEGPFAAFVK
jgi:23S rRNA pseudouridine1911/1915/1917 synthase